MKKNKYKLNFLILTFLLLSCEQKANQVVQITTNPNEHSTSDKSLQSPISTTDIPNLEVDFVKKLFNENFELWTDDLARLVFVDIIEVKIFKDVLKSSKACSTVLFLYRNADEGPNGPVRETQTGTKWQYGNNGWYPIEARTRFSNYYCSSYKISQ